MPGVISPDLPRFVSKCHVRKGGTIFMAACQSRRQNHTKPERESQAFGSRWHGGYEMKYIPVARFLLSMTITATPSMLRAQTSAMQDMPGMSAPGKAEANRAMSGHDMATSAHMKMTALRS